MINIKDFDPSLIKIDKKSYKNIGIYHIRYITIKSISDCENINSVYLLYLMVGEVGRYNEENTGNKYLTFASTEKNKEVLEKYTIFGIELNIISNTVNADKSGKYKKDYLRIKFNSDDDLPLNKY